MKKIALLYNPIGPGYYFSNSGNPYEPSKRVFLGDLSTDRLLDELKGLINFKRKTLFQLIDLPKETVTGIRRLVQELNGSFKLELVDKTKQPLH